VIEPPVDRIPPTRAVLRLGGRMAERAREVLGGREEPVEPRDAATVMLLRPASTGQVAPGASDAAPGGAGSGQSAAALSAASQAVAGQAGAGADCVEVYMLRRAPSMAFMPGAYVFPGGSVDPRDAGGDVAWAGPDAAEWGAALAAPAHVARALVCAAVRETFEESGVLLAGPSADQIVADTRGEDWEADRRGLLDRSLSLADLLAQRRLVLRADLLMPWARWITPATEERRYDTRFFAAALPAGQRTRDVGGEADQVAWVRPGEAIGAARRGEIRLMPPTAVTLAELGACRDVPAALAQGRRMTAVLPEVVLAEDGVWLTLPAELEYPL
jgi:8-oxo-dGTP pyrophosphatase MutT (NUDIX family)